MDSRTSKRLRVVAGVLVFVTAAYHLWWGFPRSLIYLAAVQDLTGRGLPPDPRPFLFVALGLALLAGPQLVMRDVISLRNAYIAGVVLLAGSITAWVVWHATGHGAFLIDGLAAPETGSDGHSHGSTALLVLDHFNTEPVEAALKTIEATAIAIFVTLLWKDPAIAPRDRTEQAAVTES